MYTLYDYVKCHNNNSTNNYYNYIGIITDNRTFPRTDLKCNRLALLFTLNMSVQFADCQVFSTCFLSFFV